MVCVIKIHDKIIWQIIKAWQAKEIFRMLCLLGRERLTTICENNAVYKFSSLLITNQVLVFIVIRLSESWNVCSTTY